MRNYVVPYFLEKIDGHLPRERISDLVRELNGIIQTDAYIADEQKRNFTVLATIDTLNEFLAEALIYVMKKENSIPIDIMFPTNNIPYLQNIHFTGRDDTLRSIHECFRRGESGSLTQTISGLGGVGKTQIALEYAYRFAGEYDTVWWIIMETTESAYKGVIDFVKKYKLLRGEDDFTVIINAFLSWFENNGNWLLIFDNVEDIKTIEPFIPKKNNGNTLITTRSTQRYVGKRVDVDVFDEPVAVAFLRDYTGINDEANAKLLARRLGYLPLALELAAAYIAVSPTTDFKEYLSLLERGLEVLDEGVSITDYGRTIRATWQISLDKIQSESARQLLHMCAYFAPDNIPLSAFVEEAESTIIHNNQNTLNMISYCSPKLVIHVAFMTY